MPSNCNSQKNTTTVDRQKTLGTLKITSLKNLINEKICNYCDYHFVENEFLFSNSNGKI